MAGDISSPSWQCIPLIVLAFRGLYATYHLLREPKTTIECIHDSLGKENRARQEKGSVIIPLRVPFRYGTIFEKLTPITIDFLENSIHGDLVFLKNPQNYSRLKRKSAFREFEDTVEGSEMARKPPGIHPKPVVNNGIFTISTGE